MTRRGRPSVLSDEVLVETARLRGEDRGHGRIADAVGVGKTTVRRVIGKSGFGKPRQNSSEASRRRGGCP